MASPISSLYVELALNMAKIREDTDAMRREYQRSTNAIEQAFAKMGTFIGGVLSSIAVGSFVKEVMSAAQAADELGKSAERIGVDTEGLSRLRYAAKYADVEVQTLDRGLQNLNKIMVEAIQGGASKGAKALTALGVELKRADGTARDTTDVVADLADVFEKLGPSAERGKLAADLFGQKIGGQFINLLGEGRASLQAFADEADRMGITLGQKAVDDATLFNDTMTRTKSIFNGLVNSVSQEVVPTWTQLLEAFNASEEAADGLRVASDALGLVMKALAATAVVVGGAFKAVGLAIGGTAAAAKAAAERNFKEAGGILRTMLADIRKVDEETTRTAKKMIEGMSEAEKAQATAAAKLRASARRHTDAINDLNGAMERHGTNAQRAIKEAVSDFDKLSLAMAEALYVANQGDESSTWVARLTREIDLGKVKLSEYQKAQLLAQATAVDAAHAAMKARQDEERALDALTKQSQSDQAREFDRLEKLKRAYDEQVEPRLRLAAAYEDLAAMRALNIIQSDQELRALENLAKVDFEKSLGKQKDFWKDLLDAVQGFGKQATSAIIDWASGVETSFTDMVAHVLREMAKMLLYQKLIQPLMSWFSGGMGGGWGGLVGAVGKVGTSAMQAPMAATRAAMRTASSAINQIGAMPMTGPTGYPSVAAPQASAAQRAGDVVSNVSVAITAEKNPSPTDASKLAKEIDAAVRRVLAREQLPGGMLA